MQPSPLFCTFTPPSPVKIGFRHALCRIPCVRTARSSLFFSIPHVILGDFFIPAFQCPHRIERIGQRADGGKWMCGVDRVAKQDKCVIYSFGLTFLCLDPSHYCCVYLVLFLTGVNDDSSYESTLLRRAPGCEIWGYDFSVANVRVAPFLD